MAKNNKNYDISKRYDYYEYIPDGELKYKHINKKRNTGERIIPMVNKESKFKMNVYNINKCLFVEDVAISGWFTWYKNSIETTGYTKGAFDGDREDRFIYCKDNLGVNGKYHYYKIEHEIDSSNAYNEQMWGIINERGFLWKPTQIYSYYFPELDECNKPTGRYFVRLMDINPMSITYTQIKIVETEITEGIIKTEKDGKDSNKYINIEGGKNLMHTE